VGDLKSSLWIYIKGWLFLIILIVSAGLLLLQHRNWSTGALILLVIWSAARFYYFMFYVIEKYVDPSYKFDGILSFLRYLFRARKER